MNSICSKAELWVYLHSLCSETVQVALFISVYCIRQWSNTRMLVGFRSTAQQHNWFPFYHSFQFVSFSLVQNCLVVWWRACPVGIPSDSIGMKWMTSPSVPFSRCRRSSCFKSLCLILRQMRTTWRTQSALCKCFCRSHIRQHEFTTALLRQSQIQVQHCVCVCVWLTSAVIRLKSSDDPDDVCLWI